MVFDRYAPLMHIRCSCGEVKPIPLELFPFCHEPPRNTDDYARIELTTGFKVLFPSEPKNKLIWLCPTCWSEVKRHVHAITDKLYNLHGFNLAQLTDLRPEDLEREVQTFERETAKWRGKQ
jgi:hypothetical protein